MLQKTQAKPKSSTVRAMTDDFDDDVGDLGRRRGPRRDEDENDNGPADESKRDRFKRIAQLRTRNVLKAIHILSGIGRNKSNYDYGNTDLEKVFTAIRTKLDEAERGMAIVTTESVKESFEF